MGVVVFRVFRAEAWRRFGLLALLAAGVVLAVKGGGRQASYEAVPVAAGPLRRGEIVYSVPTTEKLMSFAVNIDWGEEFLPGMLSVFEEKGVRVTFFPTGRWAGLHPETLRGLLAAGHELGNHGFRHDHPKQLGDEALREHIVRNKDQLLEITGAETVLYAPPYGEADARIARIADETGHWTIMWTLDTVDWQRPAPSVIVQRIVPRARPGSIVLMHPTEPTLAALPTMIQSLQAEGYELIPIGELIERGQATP